MFLILFISLTTGIHVHFQAGESGICAAVTRVLFCYKGAGVKSRLWWVWGNPLGWVPGIVISYFIPLQKCMHRSLVERKWCSLCVMTWTKLTWKEVVDVILYWILSFKKCIWEDKVYLIQNYWYGDFVKCWCGYYLICIYCLLCIWYISVQLHLHSF